VTRWDLSRDYRAIPTGRDAYMVKVIGPWLEAAVSRAIHESSASSVRVLDIGCGEEPLRKVIEEAGGSYAGFDIQQNSRGSVKVIGFIDRELPAPWPDSDCKYDVLLCSEVLEHVADWEAAFRNIRLLVKDHGRVVLTIPFVFPVHMEPLDFFRGTFYVVERFAQSHRFVVEELVKLGNARDVLSTILDDISILPKRRTLTSRVATRIIRACRRILVKTLQSHSTWSLVHVNANIYLSNGVILRAEPRQDH
jgi:SAM-dependent methyltransferase